MSETLVTMVYPFNVAPMWPQVEPLLKKAISLDETHTPKDVLSAVISGNSQLWVQWANKSAEMAVVTHFVSYPQGTRLRVWLGGSKEGAKVDHKKMDDMLVEFAKANRCIGMEIIGREGWARLFPDAEKSAVLLKRTFPLETLQ